MRNWRSIHREQLGGVESNNTALQTTAEKYCRLPVSRPTVLIAHHGCVPIYRKSFYRRLNELGTIDYVVVHGAAPRGSALLLAPPPYNFPNLPVANREFRIAGRSCIWQPIVWRAIKGDFDAAVIGDEIKFVSSLIVALALRIRRRPFLLWGFGFHQYTQRQETLLAQVTAACADRVKKAMYRIASGYLAYTEGGAKALRSLSAPPQKIAVLKNTIDTEREAELRATVASEPRDDICRDLGICEGATTLLYFGRLIAAKHVDLLVKYAQRCVDTGRKVSVLIFGQGAEEARLRELSHGLSSVVFHQPADDLTLARALRVSAAVVIPGYVGLAVTHGFAHGVPVLTRRSQLQSPEVEYIEDGCNGLLLPEEPEAFFAVLDAFVDDQDLQRRLSEGAQQTAHTIDMDHMVATFHGLVSECLASSPEASCPMEHEQ
jgi:glycosyltransferase involved in cell wall biosynthesis